MLPIPTSEYNKRLQYQGKLEQNTLISIVDIDITINLETLLYNWPAM